jgi:hypothetical protein
VSVASDDFFSALGAQATRIRRANREKPNIFIADFLGKVSNSSLSLVQKIS